MRMNTAEASDVAECGGSGDCCVIVSCAPSRIVLLVFVVSVLFFFFFFQAEDGIRDATVTGVQTCALPIIRHTRCYRDWSSDVCSSDLMIRHTRCYRDWSSDVCSSD